MNMTPLPPRENLDDWLSKNANQDFLTDTHQIFGKGPQQFEKLWEVYCLGYAQAKAQLAENERRMTFMQSVATVPHHHTIINPPRTTFWDLFKKS